MTHPAPTRQPHDVRRIAVRVCGVVQGVGFRPFVYRLATEEALAGSIGNDTEGVLIEIEGSSARIEAFLHRLRVEVPPLARIDSIAVGDLPPRGDRGFRIVSSEVKGQVATGIPADAATCPDCLRELFDPTDRRYRYPFLNCTNCGPRFTITRRIPYDRPQTSMAVFPMCPACQAEYDDPLNRRFHAQPNACPICGPHVWLELIDDSAKASTANPSPAATPGAPGFDFETLESNPGFAPSTSEGDKAVKQTIDLLLAGRILAIKGIGGFHLAVDATNEAAVQRLRARKHRYGKPLAVMVRDLAAACALCDLTPREEALLQEPARPIVLARAKNANSVAPSVAPGLPWFGIFLPYAPLQHLLFADPRVRALVMTSANLSEEPIAIDNAEARARLGDIADAFLFHDREILQRCDDSVLAVVDGAPQFVRRARGYVPLAVGLPFDAPSLLAVGGHLKSVFTLVRGRFAYQSQHLGDLENLTGLEFFEHSLDHLIHTFEIQPEHVVHDLHPGYLSTTWAKQWAADRHLPLIAVQHHHAHIAACMAEHGREGPVIGLSLDGTGYGTDGRIWGGEVLIAEYARFTRFAHLASVPMPGGESAIREPWRMAFAHLRAAGLSLEDAAGFTGAAPQECRVLDRMIERGLNAPHTTSLGRLFDAIAAVVLQRREVDYEAQAAIELEGLALCEPDALPAYPFDLTESLEAGSSWRKSGAPGLDLETREEPQSDPFPLVLDPTPMWHELLADLRSGTSPASIAGRFHSSIARAFIQAALRARSATAIQHVALSGGCLHNRRLARLLRSGLEAEGFTVLQHRRVSPGDAGLSYGQAAVASALIQHQRG